MTITPALLTETIHSTVADWIAAGRIADTFEIGNGHCYDFAEEIMTQLGSTEYGNGYTPAESFGRLIDVCTEDWWAASFAPTEQTPMRRLKPSRST